MHFRAFSPPICNRESLHKWSMAVRQTVDCIGPFVETRCLSPIPTMQFSADLPPPFSRAVGNKPPLPSVRSSLHTPFSNLGVGVPSYQLFHMSPMMRHQYSGHPRTSSFSSSSSSTPAARSAGPRLLHSICHLSQPLRKNFPQPIAKLRNPTRR